MTSVAGKTGVVTLAASDITGLGGNLSALANVATARTDLGLGTLATQSGTFSGTSSGVNTGDQTTITGNAGSATALATGRTLAITGDLTYASPAFTGSGNVTAAGTLATVNANVGAFGSSSAIPIVTVISPRATFSTMAIASSPCTEGRNSGSSFGQDAQTGGRDAHPTRERHRSFALRRSAEPPALGSKHGSVGAIAARRPWRIKHDQRSSRRQVVAHRPRSKLTWPRFRGCRPPGKRGRFARSMNTSQTTVADDADSLHHFVRELIVAHDGGAETVATIRPIAEQPGDVIGPYTLQECLGEGGFGTVWRAAQERPVRRTVAVKVLKPGMDSAEILARFAQERQALAMMEHPGIARVIDGGATPAGRPYFVMELVSGSPITKFCEARQLSTRDRLSLIVDVSRAVQHAHQKGIVHRDLKPANILVAEQDGRAVPKVIDFGIAKALCEERLTEESIRTQLGGIIGTPAYMSPEQLSGSGTADTRTDIYSLGVVLYELLTGQTPIAADELRAAWRHAGFQRCLETPLAKPSTQVKTLPPEVLRERAAARGLEPAAFLRSLRGDLDWIAMKALAREPERRYATANALAEDLTRFLTEQPILARPPSRGYLLRRFVQRNRVAVAAATAVVLSLVMGIVASTVLFLREKKARATATVEAEKSREVAQFLSDTLASAGVSKSLGRDATMMREVLDKTSERIGRELSNRPEVEAELRSAIGRTYEDLDEYERAAEHLLRALDLRRQQAAGRDDARLAGALHDYAAALEKMSRYAEAEPLVRDSIAMFERVLGRANAQTGEAHSLLAWLLVKLERSAEGEESARIAMQMWDRDPGNLRLAEAPKTLACVLKNTARGAEAEGVYRRELEALRKKYGAENPNIAVCLDNFGMQLLDNGKLDEAEQMILESLAQGRKFFGLRSPYEDHADSMLAQIARKRGDFAAELKYSREGVEAVQRVYPAGHQYREDSFTDLVEVLQRHAATRLEEAWAARAHAEEAAPLAAQARERLAELEAFGRSQSEVPTEGPWVNCLRGFARVVAGEVGAEAERLLVEGERALRAKAEPSAEEKQQVAKAAEYLVRLREAGAKP